MNPSFEASGEPVRSGRHHQPGQHRGLGWAKEPMGSTWTDWVPFGDNGRTSESDFVGFISGLGSLTQTLDSLVVGNDYKLTFEYNARTGRQSSIDCLCWVKSRYFRNRYLPVGGNNAYRTRFGQF